MEKEREEIIRRRKIDGDVDGPTDWVDIVQSAFSNVNRRQRFAIELQSSNGRLQYHIHGEYKSNMYSRDAVFLFSNTILFSFLS